MYGAVPNSIINGRAHCFWLRCRSGLCLDLALDLLRLYRLPVPGTGACTGTTYIMAGLGLFGIWPKIVDAVTMLIATAFNFCTSLGPEKGHLNRSPIEVRS